MPAPDLSTTVALVAGASRGVGRGVAHALGEAGATVYVTGRTLKGARRRGAPGSIDETASEVSRLGGRGVAVQTDHTRVEDVRALVEALRRREGRLDLVVHAVRGGPGVGLDARPVWDEPLATWDATLRAGVWSALLTARFVAPLLIETAAARRRTPIVATVAPDSDGAAGGLYHDLTAASLVRLAHGLAQDLRPHGVASVALVPGLVRTERVLEALGTSERRWGRVEALAGSESPRYAGRALAALAADPAVFSVTGRTLRAADLARRYGVTDLDGSQPGPSGDPAPGPD